DAERAADVLDRIRGEDVSEHHLRQMLQSGSIRLTDRRARFIGIDAYEAAGGPVTRDLFSQDVFMEDAGLLDDLFAAKLAEAAEAVQAEGWKWAETSMDDYIARYQLDERKFARLYPQEGDLTEAEAEEYDELAELANGEALDEDGAIRLAELQAIAD